METSKEPCEPIEIVCLTTGNDLDEANGRVEAGADALFQLFKADALNRPGEHGIPHKDVQPTVPNIEKLEEGRAFYHRHLMSCNLGIVLGLLAGAAVQRAFSVVLRGLVGLSSKDVLVRAVSSVQHVNEWLKEGFEDHASKNGQNVYKVRKLHVNAAQQLTKVAPMTFTSPKNDQNKLLEAVRANLAYVPNPDYIPDILTDTPPVFISQFDMVITLIPAFFLQDINPRRPVQYCTSSKPGSEKSLPEEI